MGDASERLRDSLTAPTSKKFEEGRSLTAGTLLCEKKSPMKF